MAGAGKDVTGHKQIHTHRQSHLTLDILDWVDCGHSQLTCVMTGSAAHRPSPDSAAPIAWLTSQGGLRGSLGAEAMQISKLRIAIMTGPAWAGPFSLQALEFNNS
jgi:hypothetical protein